MAVLAGKGDSLEVVVDQVVSTNERVLVERAGIPVAVIMSAGDMAGLEFSIDLLSEPRTVRRILESEAALQSGSLYMGEELAALDPDAHFVVRSVPGAAPLFSQSRPGDKQWGLVASVPTKKALGELQPHVADAVRSFIFGELLANPVASGVELRGFLSRRLAARVETALVIYRLDSVKHLIRLVEIFNLGGLVGRQVNPHW